MAPEFFQSTFRLDEQAFMSGASLTQAESQVIGIISIIRSRSLLPLCLVTVLESFTQQKKKPNEIILLPHMLFNLIAGAAGEVDGVVGSCRNDSHATSDSTVA